jgi:hypothetical protein
VWTDKDDQEIKYGEWYEYDAKDALAEANKVKSAPQLEEIWPNWRDGVPTKFYKRLSSQAFFRGGNFHREVYSSLSVRPVRRSMKSSATMSDRRSSRFVRGASKTAIGLPTGEPGLDLRGNRRCLPDISFKTDSDWFKRMPRVSSRPCGCIHAYSVL